MPPVHQCNQIERISKIEQSVALTNNDISYMKSEITEIKTTQKEGFASVHKKIDDFISSIDIKYATKEEVNGIKKDVQLIKSNTNSTRVEWIKVWGGWIAAIIGGVITLLTIYLNK